ncbi:hypothetical protein GEMRC1_003026 [Eukaryota sp. GEM-RC1]
MAHVLHSIECIVLEILNCIASGESPVIRLPKGDPNVYFHEVDNVYRTVGADDRALVSVSLQKAGSSYKFGIYHVGELILDVLLRSLTVIYELVQNNQRATKRELFYSDPALFKTQRTSDQALSDWSRLLSVPRNNLNVYAEAKGVVYGDLVYYDGHHAVNCRSSPQGIPITPFIQNISDITSKNLQYIIVVEKDAALFRLIEDDVISTIGSSVLITGCGFPDYVTRAFLYQLSIRFPDVPVIGLADADPYGLDILCMTFSNSILILCTYRFGSLAAAAEENLAVPRLRWLGVTVDDLYNFDIPESALLPLTSTDKKRGENMLDRDCWSVAPQWKEQLERMLEASQKAEIQALLSVDGNMNFLSQQYIPSKLSNKLLI